ncbi:hypothetical protein [Xanthomarina spongicola]|uniref:Uncharacterized protein n=1 Tax=Xanthomarina spongicola TaxID=570520 RepID=A0A316E210_9FLAO|nr:hypothetical protein [Xanthomarina spongicola]PWK16880.1 hypothetical protein LX78_02936 [Xanthomarina spongicola]
MRKKRTELREGEDFPKETSEAMEYIHCCQPFLDLDFKSDERFFNLLYKIERHRYYLQVEARFHVEMTNKHYDFKEWNDLLNQNLLLLESVEASFRGYFSGLGSKG